MEVTDRIIVRRRPNGQWSASTHTSTGTPVKASGESSVEAHLALLEKLADIPSTE